MANEEDREKGRVKWYDKTKGFGFIESSEGDVFFHFSDINMEGFKALAEDQLVSYVTLETDRGLSAKEIVPVHKHVGVTTASRYKTMVSMWAPEGKVDQLISLWRDVPERLERAMDGAGFRITSRHRDPEDDQLVVLIVTDKPFEAARSRLAELGGAHYTRWWDMVKKRCDKDEEPVVLDPA
jgi:CspA family cold shock protein